MTTRTKASPKAKKDKELSIEEAYNKAMAYSIETPKSGIQYAIQSALTVAVGAGMLYGAKKLSDVTGLSGVLSNASDKAMGLVGFGNKEEEKQQPQMRIVSNQ